MTSAPFIRAPLTLLEVGDHHESPLAPDLQALDPPELRERRERLVDELVQLGDARSAPVIEALRTVPRHLFVPALERLVAYDNYPLAIGHQQTISQPSVVAMMTEALELTGLERVLEVGTGSGYQAAVLSLLAQEVCSIERVPALGRAARERLRRLGFDRVEVRVGDGYAGWQERAPFDRIVVTAAPEEIPRALADQLADDGVMVVPVGGPAGQDLIRARKIDGRLHQESLGMVWFVPMLPGSGGDGAEEEGTWS